MTHRFPLVLSLAAASTAFLVAGAHAQSGIVNAPVAPEAIYVGSGGLVPGISVIDLNGFGQGTGDFSRSRFILNPNVGRAGVTPPLTPGSSNLDAGGEGAMTLTRNNLGGTTLIGPPTVGRITDLALGQPLDLVYNDSNINPNARAGNQVNPATLTVMPGNTIMVAPHPNPPRLVFPAPNPSRGIEAEEPTVTSSVGPLGTVTTSPPCLPSPVNLLVPGNPFSNDPTTIGIFGASFPGVFYGPQPAPPLPPPPLAFCPFTCRQQIGHFLYALDADNDRIAVLNSNRFSVLAIVPLPDPTSMAMAPNLKLLAVSNDRANTVSFLDTDPLSPTFHQVIGTAEVGAGPAGLAWQPEGEDLLVCNRRSGTVSVISATTLHVRKTLRLGISRPIDVAVGARQVQHGFLTATYFAFILNSNGTIAIYESGPELFGLDDITAIVGGFPAATAIQPDIAAAAGCWVAHRDAAGLAQLSRLELTSSPVGPLPVRATDHRPNGRFRSWTVTARIGGSNPTTPVKDRFSGNTPVDLAFDDILNYGAFPDVRSVYRPALVYAQHSGKGHRKSTPGGAVPATRPLFVAVGLADTGKVDLFELAIGRRIRTLDVPGVLSLGHYWRE